MNQSQPLDIAAERALNMQGLTSAQNDLATALRATGLARAMPDTTVQEMTAKAAAVNASTTNELTASARCNQFRTTIMNLDSAPRRATLNGKLPYYRRLKSTASDTLNVDDPYEWYQECTQIFRASAIPVNEWFDHLATRLSGDVLNWASTTLATSFRTHTDERTFDLIFKNAFIARQITPAYKASCVNKLMTISQGTASIRKYHEVFNQMMQRGEVDIHNEVAISAYIKGLRSALQTKIVDRVVDYGDYTSVVAAQSLALRLDPTDRGDGSRFDTLHSQAGSSRQTSRRAPPPSYTTYQTHRSGGSQGTKRPIIPLAR